MSPISPTLTHALTRATGRAVPRVCLAVQIIIKRSRPSPCIFWAGTRAMGKSSTIPLGFLRESERASWIGCRLGGMPNQSHVAITIKVNLECSLHSVDALL